MSPGLPDDYGGRSSFKSDIYSYLGLLRPYLIVAVTLFTAAALAGIISGYLNPTMAGELMEQFEDTYGWLAGENPLIIMLFVFANNVLNSFLAMLFGVFFGIWSIIFILLNGFFIGAVIFESAHQFGVLVVLAALFPHGIIELPMVLISAAIGLRLGSITFQKVYKETDVSIKQELLLAVKFFFIVVVPMLFIAAFIETFITSTIVYMLISP